MASLIPSVPVSKKRIKPAGLSRKPVEKVDTIPRGNAVRSKIKDFRTALYPRQYHPCAHETHFISGFSLTRSFSNAPVAVKTKCGFRRRKIKF